MKLRMKLTLVAANITIRQPLLDRGHQSSSALTIPY